MRGIGIILIIFTSFLITSCGYIQLCYNKKIYNDEFKFVNKIIENPSKADSLIINCSYFEQVSYEKYKTNSKSLRVLEDDRKFIDPPKIKGMYINKNYRPAFTNYDTKLLSIEVYRNMRPGYQTIIFLFTKIDNQMKLVDILWVVM